MTAPASTAALDLAGGMCPTPRTAPAAVVLAGLPDSTIVTAALRDTALTTALRVHVDPGHTPPAETTLWRLETAAGEGLHQPGLLREYWHRRPYAITIRLARYHPGSMVPEVLDSGTLGTRRPFPGLCAAVERLAMRLVRDAAMGRGRSPQDIAAAPRPFGRPGRLDAFLARWHSRLMAEWWSIGTSTATVSQLLSGQGLGPVSWHRIRTGCRYLADPFPWPGTGRILCEEMPIAGGVGRIVSVAEQDGILTPPQVMLDDGMHHSYPCTLATDDGVYCIPESTERGATRIYHLDRYQRLTPVCDVAPNARLADPTLFRWHRRYWLACTDLDLGTHDNLCLLHAPRIEGPWQQHAFWPVRIDIRGARPAGALFTADGTLYRPGQNCARTYGAALAIHEILTLTESEFRERLVTELHPDRSGPFPHGLHTLVHDGQRFWVDGKRFVFDASQLRRKLRQRLTPSASAGE